MDRRESRRYKVQLPVAFSGDRIAGKGTVCNLGTRGCAVKSGHTLKVGAFVELRIDVPTLDAPLLVDLAVVRWSVGQEFGLDFLQLRPEEQKRLKRFVKKL